MIFIFYIPLIASEWSEPRAAILMLIPFKYSTLVGKGTMFGAPTFQQKGVIFKVDATNQPFSLNSFNISDYQEYPVLKRYT